MSDRTFFRLLLVVGVLWAAPTAAQASAPDGFRAARDLERGAVLTADDYGGDGEAAAADGPIGWVTRRVVREGEMLRPPAIAPARVVRSGEQVHVVWAEGAVELRLTGRAMNDAAAGDPVRVRVDRRRRFEGTANEDGTVRLVPMKRHNDR